MELQRDIPSSTYPCGVLDMLDKHDHLLSRDERGEIFKGPTVVVRLELGPVAFPSDATGNGKQVVHELGRTRNSNVNGAVAEAGRTSLVEVALPALNDRDGSLHRGELDIDIVGLAADTVHDDVDWLLGVVQDLRVAAHEGDDLGAGDIEGDLYETPSQYRKSGNRGRR